MSLAYPIRGGAKLGHLAKEFLCFNSIPLSSLPLESSSTWLSMYLVSKTD